MTPLRVAVLVGSLSQPKWVAALLDSLRGRQDVIVRVLLPGTADQRGATTRPPVLLRALLRVDRKLASRLYHVDDGDSTAAVDLRPDAGGEEDEAFDVVLFIDLDRVPELAARAGLGWWVLRHESPGPLIHGLPGFAEWVRGEAVVSTALHGGRPGARQEVVLDRAHVRADPLSLHSTLAAVAAQQTDMVLRAVDGARGVADGPSAREGVPSVAGPPTMRDSVDAFLRWGARWMELIIRRLFVRDAWRLWIARSPGEPDPARLASGHAVGRPGQLVADPHLVTRDGKTFLFCEEADREWGSHAALGRLSVAQLAADGPMLPFRTVLSDREHLSFPFVFQADHEWFLIPESEAHREVRLYRSVTWPDVWELDRVLLGGVAYVDVVVHHHDNRWWMFAARPCYRGGPADTLDIYSADNVRGPWVPHLRNPVIRDVRCARAAGAIQRIGRRLIRPAQNGARHYGGSIELREIVTLTTTEYEERAHAAVVPGWSHRIRGAHSWSYADGWLATDIAVREFRWW